MIARVSGREYAILGLRLPELFVRHSRVAACHSPKECHTCPET